jgi:hypothetical protein
MLGAPIKTDWSQLIFDSLQNDINNNNIYATSAAPNYLNNDEIITLRINAWLRDTTAIQNLNTSTQSSAIYDQIFTKNYTTNLDLTSTTTAQAASTAISLFLLIPLLIYGRSC